MAAAQRFLDNLARLEDTDLADPDLAAKMPALGAAGPLREAVGRLTQRVSQFGQRLQELEHVRAAAEVRAHRLATERQQIAEILASLSDPVLAIDHYDELVLANHSAEELFDFHASGTEHRALDQLVRCESLVELLLDTRRRKTPAQRTSEIELTDREGRQHFYRVTCRSTLAQNENGHEESGRAGAVAILNDISGQKAIQKRNAEFVSSVSHEMKTPLAGIKAYVELLADDDAEDEATREEFLSVINSQADRLQRLIDNMLNLARIEAGVVNVNKEGRSLNELLEEAFHVVQPAAERKQIQLECELSPMYLGVLADRDMLLQAAINLLSNAIKYTPDGGQVTLRSRMEHPDVVFEVEDTGVGLSPEDCEKVFQKFYRVQKDQQMASGTGLGLPLAKHIVEDVHGGHLTVRSELGKGSIFAVTMPSESKIDR